MYNGSICEMLSEAEKARYFSVISCARNKQTGEWEKHIILQLSLYNLRVYATRNGGKGNLILLSDNRMLMDDLYHLCHLINYDVNYEELGDFRALELISSNGGSIVTSVDSNSLHIHVDDKNPDHYFDK